MLVHDKFFNNAELIKFASNSSSYKIHLYHLYLHQELYAFDFQNRVQFVEWFLQQMSVNGNFCFKNVLFTDEVTFTNHDNVNLRNLHYIL